MKVFFSKRAYLTILIETMEKIKTETGGLFLGKFENDICYIVETIDPGPNSLFKEDLFKYDRKYTEHLINKIRRLYVEDLELVGLWHRHPGSFDRFSKIDDITNTKFSKMRREGAISALVNIDPNFRLNVFHVSDGCNYEKVDFEVENSEILDKYCMNKNAEDIDNRITEIISGKNTKIEKFMDKFIKSRGITVLRNLKDAKKINEKDENLLLIPKDIEIDSDEFDDKILDSCLDDIYYILEKVNIKLNLDVEDGNLCVYDQNFNYLLAFGKIKELDLLLLKYKDNIYIYKKDIIRNTCENLAYDEVLN